MLGLLPMPAVISTFTRTVPAWMHWTSLGQRLSSSIDSGFIEMSLKVAVCPSLSVTLPYACTVPGLVGVGVGDGVSEVVVAIGSSAYAGAQVAKSILSTTALSCLE